MSAFEGGGELAVTLTCIREQRQIVAEACAELARSLRTGAVAEGLAAVERICATALMIDVLIDFLTRTGASQAVLDEAHRVRGRMLRASSVWLAAAIHDLPGARELAHRFLCAPREARDLDKARRGGGGDHE